MPRNKFKETAQGTSIAGADKQAEPINAHMSIGPFNLVLVEQKNYFKGEVVAENPVGEWEIVKEIRGFNMDALERNFTNFAEGRI